MNTCLNICNSSLRSVQGKKRSEFVSLFFLQSGHLLGSKLTNYLTKRVNEIENWRMGGTGELARW